MILVDLATLIVVLAVVVLAPVLVGHLAVLMVDLVIMADMEVAMILVVVMGVSVVVVLLVIKESHHLAIPVAMVPIWEALVGDMVGVG